MSLDRYYVSRVVVAHTCTLVSVCVRVRVSVRACVRACVRVCAMYIMILC